MVCYHTAMDTLTIARRKPGPAPKNGPKARTQGYAVYPIHRDAIRWWNERHGSDSESAALRQMIDRAMSLALGEDWADKLEDAA